MFFSSMQTESTISCCDRCTLNTLLYYLGVILACWIIVLSALLCINLANQKKSKELLVAIQNKVVVTIFFVLF